MILCGLLGLLVGLIIGGRFKIFAAVPAQACALLILLAPALFGTASLWHQAALGLIFCLALQAGYVLRLVVGTPSARRVPMEPHQV